MLEGFNWCQEPDHIKEKTFQKVYLQLINEWSSSLFAPEPLLRQIIEDFSHLLGYGALIYTNKEVLNLLNENTYKFYDVFYKVIHNNPDFKIVVAYLDKNNKKEYDTCLKYVFSQYLIDRYYNTFSKMQAYACNDCINIPFEGCVILLDRNHIKKNDYNEMEYYLDHQLNHYFSIFKNNDENIKNINKNSISNKLKKIALDAGFNLNSSQSLRDFIYHVLSKNQFYQMLCDTNNTIHLFFNSKNKYYDWMNMIKSSYIQSEQYQKLDYHLQNSIIFCYFIKVLDPYRWNIIKNSIKEQLHNPKRNLWYDIKNKINEFYQRYKVKKR